jgi:hypothetical protein
MTTPRCVLCGRPEDEATPSFSSYLHGVDSRCPECGKPQGADLVDRAEVEGELAEYDVLKDLILTLLPYALDDGEDPPNEANAEECVEYAADEIARLRSQNAALRAEVAALRLAADEVLSWNLNDTSALLSNPPQNAALFHAQRVLRAACDALDARRKDGD